MIILAVDDEYIGLMALKDAIKKASPEAEIVDFSDPKEALRYVKGNPVDVAFLDIFMEGMTGIELAKKIKVAAPNVHIIFQTGYDEYMKDAFDLHARGYVLKPVTKQKIKKELENIQPFLAEKPVSVNAEKRVVLQCFGNFEVFIDGTPLKFKYDKTKEMLAFITSRNGALCSNNEIISNIWEEDGGHESYLRGLRKDLLDTFSQHGLEDVFVQQRGKISICIDKVSCDYYEFLEGDVNALNRYFGEFMNQYSWGEPINANIFNEKTQ